MLEGLIIFKLINVGSKSEGLRPFLYGGKGKFLEVTKADDYTLGCDSLLPFDGKRVTIDGELDENVDIFVINTISEVVENRTEEPVEATEEAEPDAENATETEAEEAPAESENLLIQE